VIPARAVFVAALSKTCSSKTFANQVCAASAKPGSELTVVRPFSVALFEVATMSGRIVGRI